jgi:hypothetical protein
MKNFFAAIYETWFQLYDVQFSLIFETLFNDGGYVLFGFLFILIPVILWILFYYVWDYPYGKFWHWLTFLLITVILVAGSTFGLANNEIFVSDNQSLINALSDPESGYEMFAQTLTMEYALFNGLLSVVMGIACSLIFKQFSKIQIHLPF